MMHVPAHKNVVAPAGSVNFGNPLAKPALDPGYAAYKNMVLALAGNRVRVCLMSESDYLSSKGNYAFALRYGEAA